MRLAVSGGGTGGHFFPALEVLREAKERKLETSFVGTERGIERNFEAEIPGEKVFLETYPLRGVPLRERIKAIKGFLKGLSVLRSRLEGEFSSLIFGGYSSVPLGLHTLFKRRSLFLHEQNSVPSMTNRSFYPFSRKVFITFEHTRRFFKGDHVIRTGLPVRRELLKLRMDGKSAKEALGFDPDSPLLLFMGGSQGARFLNTLAVDFARKTGAQVLLLSGKQDYERVVEISKGVKNLKAFPFRTDMGLVYSGADVAVCRAGAGTVSELSIFRVPALFIPYPFAAGDHQFYNAKEIEDLGGGLVIRQEEVNLDKVIALVDKIFSNLKAMSEAVGSFANPDSAKLILDEILED